MHHQGDVGTASYAAACVIVDLLARRVISDWNGYALAVTIELQRDEGENPQPPAWIEQVYEASWHRLGETAAYALTETCEEPLAGQLIGVLALRNGLKNLGRLASDFDEAERREILGAAGYS